MVCCVNQQCPEHEGDAKRHATTSGGKEEAIGWFTTQQWDLHLLSCARWHGKSSANALQNVLCMPILT